MKKLNRRKFIYSSAFVAGMPTIISSFASANNKNNDTLLKKENLVNSISLGVISKADNPEED
jgi:hypothetical protein